MSGYIVYCEDGLPEPEEFPSLEEAVANSYWQIEFDMSSPHAIQCPNGRMIEGADLHRMLKEYGDTHDNPKQGIWF